jgi:DNA repair ATPase RecN
MDDHATRLDQYAENLREMRGRLKLPSYAAWQAKCDEVEERNAREREAAERQRGYHVQTESRWFDGDEEVPF